MSAMFTSQINEVDRKTNQSFAGKSVETAGPLAMAPAVQLLGGQEHDDFSSSNPFAQNSVDYSNYSESPMATTVGESSYALAMSSFISTTGTTMTGDSGISSDGGFSGGDSGFSGGGCAGGGCGGGFSGGGGGSFSASC